MNFPNQLKYTRDHEWAKIEGKTMTVGITDHAQSALGDVVFVELPAVGKVVKPGDAFGVVESIKAVSDLYAPAAGKVIEVNTKLPDDPGTVNRDPYGEAWMIKLEISEPGNMMSVDEYKKFV